jgi:hypothetical protein
LDTEVKRRFPSVVPTRWNYNSRLLETVQNHKTDIENLFVTIIENGSDWDAETVCSARGYLALLRDFDFNFYLAMFSAIFSHSSSLFQILQSKRSDTVYCTEKTEKFKLLLQLFRENFPDSLWEEIVKMTPSSYSVKRNRMKPINGEDKKSTYKRIFTEMIDVMVANVSDRFCDVSELKFLCLLDPKHFATTSEISPLEH